MAKTFKEIIKESAPAPIHISLSVPLFIRLLELAREEIKTDVPLHKLTENIVSANRSKPVLDTSDYEKLVKGIGK